jgi:hypothetical protein
MSQKTHFSLKEELIEHLCELDVLPKEAMKTSTAYTNRDFGGSFPLPANSASTSALDTANVSNMFERNLIVVGGDDFFNALASRAISESPIFDIIL